MPMINALMTLIITVKIEIERNALDLQRSFVWAMRMITIV